MIVKRDKQTHDLSGADVLHIMTADVGARKIFTCVVSWNGVVGTDAKVKLQGSNDRIPSNFSDIAIEVTLTGSSGSHILSDDVFPNDIGGAFVEKGSTSAGIITLKFLAK